MTTLSKGAKIASNFNGVIYEIYGVNPNNKTYHAVAIFVPELAKLSVGPGQKFHISFDNIDRQYTLIFNN